jgi:hypothetical protein
MKTSTKKARYGDVAEVSTPRGVGYLQYVGKHPSYGDVIRIVPGLYAVRPADLEKVVQNVGFVTFYPFSAAVRRGFLEIVANYPIPAGGEAPARVRRAGAMAPNGRVLTWIINGEQGDYVREKLTPEETHFPIAEIWNHEMLIHQLASEWRPEKEV